MPLFDTLVRDPLQDKPRTNLESVFPGKAFFTVVAGKWFDRQMDPLVPFEIVVAIETLRTLVAFEWPFVVRRRLVTAVHLLHLRA